MSRLALAAVLLGLMPIATAQEQAPAQAEERPLFFRLKMGLETTRVVDVRLAETAGPGTGYDAAHLDLDGDGSFEFERALGETLHPRTKRKRTRCRRQ